MGKLSISKLYEIKKESLISLINLYKIAGAGHIGSSLSCLDILIYLFFHKMEANDKFILSKGHAAGGLYTVLNKRGFIENDSLKTFYNDGTVLAAHPPCSHKKIEGIIFGTGSLGHGLSLATGLALSAKISKKDFNVYCLMSDGDCNEGSTWEAAMFAAQHKLSNLIIIIDNNNLQGFGRTDEVINMEPLREKWEAFNFQVGEAENGNDFITIDRSFSLLKTSDKPKCIIARTIKGSGITFMENKLEWHYLPLTQEQYELAMQEIEGEYA